ncbi:hypothetical protein MHB78_14110 [Bacillus sp. FSL K6-0138]|uniref:hypothetical protein n=1 Tax=unclassified Bacillus (in: firmicutes) TaxID=185979 RepID=UPI00300026A0
MNYFYEEDFYHEPSEFEMKMNELKESLLSSVKEEYVAEMNRLKKENQELQIIKVNFENIKNDYRKKRYELDCERQELKRKIRKERLSELMKDFEVTMYRADYELIEQPKCNKCNAQRKIEYLTPLGKMAYETCDCAEKEEFFIPKEFICHEFRMNNDGNNILAWYKSRESCGEDYFTHEISTFAKTIYNSGMDFEKLDRWDTFFKTKEECQDYCDYMNKNNIE